jgi:hypothetical protein
MLNVTQVPKAQMINLMRKVKTVSLHIQPLDNLWIVMHTDMEITRYFVDKYEPAHFASLLIV